jgi:hypothetical protein
MRTTLDIDDDVLQAAKELAAAERKTAGKVLSDLARKALMTSTEAAGAGGPAGSVLKNGWYVLPHRGGIVTKELVDRLMEEADFEDAGIIQRKK